MGGKLAKTGILIGKDEIKKAVGIESDPLFRKFIAQGMPARLIDGRWYAHTENLDKYFKTITNVKYRGKTRIPDEGD